MEIRASDDIAGVSHLELQPHEDGRGFFMETFRASWLPDLNFVQGNLSRSDEGVLRGLHYHQRQEDLWMIPDGRATVGLVDLRAGSDTYLRTEIFKLSGPNAVLIPIGVAHGFYAETPLLMSYLVTGYYDGTDELGVAWNDPEIAMPWPVSGPILSDRDRQNVPWAEVPAELRPGS